MLPHKKNVLTWCFSMYHVIGLKQTRSITNITLKVAKKLVCVAVYWEYSTSGQLHVVVEVLNGSHITWQEDEIVLHFM